MSENRKSALVTGASRGIGRAIALQLAQDGFNIAINYNGNKEKADEVAEEVGALGVNAMVIQANVSEETAVQEMVKAVIDKFGSLDVLVNNAGITKDNLIMRMKEEDFSDVIDINLKGVFLTTKAATRQMMRQRSGKIVNVSSIVGVSGNAGQANYVAAKAGVIGLTKTTAQELAARNIQVNAVAPGFIATDMTDVLNDEQKAAMLQMIPQGKFGEASDVAKVVGFLASPQANYITGQTIHVDGGMVM